MDAMHGDEFAKAQQDIYAKGHNGILGSPGMLMGFVSYASLVDKDTLKATIDEIRQNSLAKTDFEKRQEDVIVRQLSDESFASKQIDCDGGAQMHVAEAWRLSPCCLFSYQLRYLLTHYPLPLDIQTFCSDSPPFVAVMYN